MYEKYYINKVWLIDWLVPLMEGDNNAGGLELYLFSFRFCNFMKNKGKFLPLNHYHIKK